VGNANGRYALLFRDYLRAHSLAAAACAQVKQALAQHGPFDWDRSYDVKDPVCALLMAGAEDWAAAMGWRTAHRDASSARFPRPIRRVCNCPRSAL
jgi:hypothetical protein